MQFSRKWVELENLHCEATKPQKYKYSLCSLMKADLSSNLYKFTPVWGLRECKFQETRKGPMEGENTKTKKQ